MLEAPVAKRETVQPTLQSLTVVLTEHVLVLVLDDDLEFDLSRDVVS